MKKSLLFLIIMSIVLISLCGCTQESEPTLVIVDSQEDVVSFNLIPASYDDVILTTGLDCTYVQTESQEVSFNATGKYVNKVYVEEGDYVKKGDILCELSSDVLERSIEQLEYKIKRNELQLSYLDRYEQLDIQDAWAFSMMHDDTSVYIPGADRINEKVASIEENYDKQRLAINDSLEFDRKELALKKKELKESRLYASMDGRVYKIKKGLEGSTSKAGDLVMTIVDDSTCLFEVKDVTYKDLFSEGTPVDMKIYYSEALGDYLVLPFEMEKWNDSMLFSVYTGPDNAVIDVGVMGEITIGVDKRTNVLSVPKETVHLVEDKAFVYTLNEENVREIRYVEIGLFGDERVEIISGLAEGEKVVRK